MITYVNNSNAEQYRVLWRKATKDLMGHGENGVVIAPEDISETNAPHITPTVVENVAQNFVPDEFYYWNAEKNRYEIATESTPVENRVYYQAADITSLNEYFSFIEELAAIDPIYTVLPLDEDKFKIDLNTRKIAIPEHFAQNGISVQGDEIAEILYFYCDRFFDAQDLAASYDDVNDKDMRIYIQWRSASTDENGELIEGVSVPWCIDTKSDPDHIIFGWPISSKITGTAGDITFAVRFFKFVDGKITYSLSTLDHTVQVKKALDFDILARQLANNNLGDSTLVLDDNRELIIKRLEDSTLDDDEVRAEKPFFIKNLETGEWTTQNNERLSEFWLERDPETGLLDKETTFLVQATSADAGKISYSWRHYTLQMGAPSDPMRYKSIMKETEDTSPVVNKAYYKKDRASSAEDAYSYYPVSEIIWDPEDENYVKIYEKFSEGEIPSTGYYIVTVTNRKGNSTAKIDSYRMVVSHPLPPVVEEGGAVAETAILEVEDGYEATIGITAHPADKGTLLYQWYYSIDGNPDNEEPIEGATEASYTITGGSAVTNGHAEGDGYYRLRVADHMNKEEEEIWSDGTRVTHRASKPIVTIADGYKPSYSLTEVTAKGDIKVQAEIESRFGERRDLVKDSITYQWYRYNPGERTTVDEDRLTAEAGEYEVDNDTPMPGATGEGFLPSVPGDYYFCEVCNNYNGTTTKACSPFFSITAN